MENREILKGLVNEVMQPMSDDIKAKIEAAKEENVKILEANKELKAQFDALQNKVITMHQNTGTHKYVFKGYDVTRPARNFVVDISKECAEAESKNILKALTTTGAYAVGTEFSNALYGLSELSSVALSRCRVIQATAPIVKAPYKATRATVDTQAFGTANAAAATDLGQLTWTIDKRIGSYETIYNDMLQDQLFDIVGEFVAPMISEAIGQDVDDKVFNNASSEFTTDIQSNCTAYTSVSGSVAMAAAITFANLNTIYNTVEWARGLQCEWFMPQAAYKDCMGLTDTYGQPITVAVPINGAPIYSIFGSRVNITPAISNTPANGYIRLAFGDPSKYVIMLRGGIVIEQNPYILMKEGSTQIIGYGRADGNLTAGTSFTALKRIDS